MVTVAVPASKPVEGVVLKFIVEASSVRSPPVSKVNVKSPDAVAATVIPAALNAVSSADAIAPAEALAATELLCSSHHQLRCMCLQNLQR